MNGTEWVAPESPVIVRFENYDSDQIEQSELFRLSGSGSGSIAGRCVLSNDQRTLIFQRDTPYIAGETITVRFHARLLMQVI